jgi:hypothetical protein
MFESRAMNRPPNDVDPGQGMRIGTWNLDRGKPLWQRPFQSGHICKAADLWLLTEVPSHMKFGEVRSSFSGSVPPGDDQSWAAVSSTFPMEPIPSEHPSLAMARIDHPKGRPFVAASSVFPWRTAAKYWPVEDGDTFAERCAGTLAKHLAEISVASGGLPVVWGGDFNQALSGPERVGSDVGRQALLDAFKELGLRVVTVEAAGQDPNQRSIDHIAIPEDWTSWALEVQPPQSDGRLLSDHPSYVVSVERDAVVAPVQRGT